jgi:curved DNA-binding protein CbpA
MPAVRSWAHPFTYESRDEFRKTEMERAKWLMGQTVGKLFSPTVNGEQLPPVPVAKKKKGGFLHNVTGAIDAATPEFVEGPARSVGAGALTALGAAQQYVGAPLFGVTTGRLGAPRHTGPDGQEYVTGSPSWESFARGLKKVATQNPIDTYQESREKFNLGQKDPNLPAWERIGAETLSDPLTYVGPGAVAKVSRGALAGTKAGRFAGALLENPRAASVGAVVGSAAAGQAAESANLPPWMQQIAPLAGGLAGGLAAQPGMIRRGAKAIDVATAAEEKGLAAVAKRSGLEASSPERGSVDFSHSQAYTDTLDKHNIPYEFDETGTVVPDADAMERAVDDLDHKILIDTYGQDYGRKTKGMRRPSGKPDPDDVADLERLKEVTSPDIPDPSVEIERAARVETERQKIATEEADRLAKRKEYFAQQEAARLQREAEEAATSKFETPDEIYARKQAEAQAPKETPAEKAARQATDQEELEKRMGPRMFKDTHGKTIIRMADGSSKSIYTANARGRERAAQILAEQKAKWEARPDKSTWAPKEEPVAAAPKAARGRPAKPEPTRSVATAEQLVEQAFDPSVPLDKSSPWATLGVREGASMDEVKRAYRAKLRQYHPDVNTHESATANAAAINDAFEQISSGKFKAGSSARPGASSAASGGGAAGSSPPFAGPGSAKAPPPPPPPRPKKDLFNTVSRGTNVRQETAHYASPRGKFEKGIRGAVARAGGEKLDPNIRRGIDTIFTVKEKNRIDNLTASYEGKADDLYAAVENAGIKLKPDSAGDWRMADGTSFEDMVELSTPAGRAAYAKLTKAQRDAVDAMVDWNDELNQNLRFHNKTGTLGWDAVTDRYFPRVSIGADGKARATIGNLKRGIGSKQGFAHERTFKTFEEGVKEGIDYANPRQAWRIMTRAKLRAAHDEYLAKNLKPLGVTKMPPGSRLGVDYVALPRDVAPALQGRYFEPEIAQRIVAAMGGKPAIDIPPIRGLNRVLTPLRATGDVSWFAQQGAAMLFRHPARAAKGAANVIRSVGNRQLYDRLIAAEDNHLRQHIEHGLHWTPGDDLPATDHGFVKATTQKPGLKQTAAGYNAIADFSNKTFSRYMNYTRLVFANDAFQRLEKLKPTLSAEEYRKEYIGAMNAVNRMSGFTGRKPTSLESMALFAPRYTSSSIEQLSAAISRGGIEGSIARAHIGRMLAFGAATVMGINHLRGYDTDFDPRSSNFLRIRNVGGLDVSPFGTYSTLFRAIAGTAAGDPGGGIKPDITKLWKFAEGKMSPGLKLIYEPAHGQTYTGEPLDITTAKGLVNTVKKEATSTLPFSAQNIIDEGIKPAIEERSLKPLLNALPGEAASAVGSTNSPVTPTEKRNWRRDEVAKERYGKPYDDLGGTEKSIVNEDAKVTASQADADKNLLTSFDDRSENQKVSLKAQGQITALTKRFDAHEIAGSEFRKNYHDIQMRLQGSREVIKQRQQDKEIDQWFSLYDDAEREDGSPDYEKLDELQKAFRLKHPGIDEKVDKISGTHDNATMRDFRTAQDEAAEYYELPQYRGMSLEDGKIAARVLRLTSRLTSNDQASGYRQALALLRRQGQITDAEARLALRAQKAGTSIERKKFATTHPLFALFYKDAVAGDVPAIGSVPNASRKTSSGLPELPNLPRIALPSTRTA